MMRTRILVLSVCSILASAGCTTLRETAALNDVKFSFDRVTNVRVAGVTVDGKDSYTDVGVTDVAKLTAAVLGQNVPTNLVVHVKAENPSSNSVTARMIQLGWTFFVEDRKVLDGKLDSTYAFAPGQPVDVRVPITFDAYDLYEHNAEDLFELGLALADVGGYEKEVRLDLVPTVNTDLGPITYPSPITVKRTVD